jgi:glycosyltransferase involved in cell wall biosynthesis
MNGTAAPDVAVIVPTRDRRHLLPQALESVFSQTYANFEVIVVDDGSEDDTSAYLATIADRRLKWQRLDGWRGANAARNLAVELSRAPILSFLDSDDCYRSGRLSRVVEFFSRHPDIDIHISSYTSVAGSARTELTNPDAIFSADQLERYLIGYCLFLGGSGISIRKRAFVEIGGFDPTMPRMQDREFLLRAARTRGCASVVDIDWIKSATYGSLSRERKGRVYCLGELCRRHPIIRERYAVLFRYLVAREILGPLIQFKFGLAVDAIRDASRSPTIDLSLLQLVPGYFRGKRRRRELKREIDKLRSQASCLSTLNNREQSPSRTLRGAQ